jgi:peptidyl-prolyl cis-trans isomerase SurA
MTSRRHMPRFLFALIVICLGSATSRAQASATQSSDGSAVVLDRVIAVINGDVLLESDVQDEMHFASLQPYSVPPGENTRLRAAQRLVNRTLILQQMKDPQQTIKVPQPSEKEVQQRIDELRKQIPACTRYHCETDEGWHDFLTSNGFTEEQVEARWRQRLRILQFTEERFRSGIRVSRPEVEAYYQKNLLPQFEKEKVAPPTLDSIVSRIEEILLQEKVNVLLQDWLRTLRDQGNVLILDPAYGKSNPAGSDSIGGSNE